MIDGARAIAIERHPRETRWLVFWASFPAPTPTELWRGRLVADVRLDPSGLRHLVHAAPVADAPFGELLLAYANGIGYAHESDGGRPRLDVIELVGDLDGEALRAYVSCLRTHVLQARRNGALRLAVLQRTGGGGFGVEPSILAVSPFGRFGDLTFERLDVVETSTTMLIAADSSSRRTERRFFDIGSTRHVSFVGRWLAADDSPVTPFRVAGWDASDGWHLDARAWACAPERGVAAVYVGADPARSGYAVVELDG